MKWTRQYIGIPWVAGGRTKDACDCWGLVRLIYKEQLGVEFPDHILDPSRTKAVMRCMASQLEEWQRIETPEHMCLAVMGKGDTPSHVGLYLSSGKGIIIHSVDGHTSCAESLNDLRRSYKLFQFYTHGSLCDNL